MIYSIEQKYTTLSALFSPQELEKSRLHSAFEQAVQALDGRTRENGDPFIFHALDVAQIVAAEVGLGAQAAAAVLLHETDCVHPLEAVGLERTFGKEVASMVNSLSKIARLDLKTTALQAEAFRKLIVSYSTNPQVIVIKLADRLEVMRSLSFFPKSKHAKKSAETLLLFAPLAHKLGLYKLKSELEDLSLRYTDPAVYRSINTKLKLSEKARSQLVEDFIAPLRSELQKKNYSFDLKYRTKSAYSIWSKMQKQGVPFEGVYDVFAIRIILDMPPDSRKDEVAACWDVYSTITSRYEPDLKRLRDWVTKPKESGYESLHATVRVAKGQDVEVQIRTRRMDDNAEHGMAAHWRYKGVQQDNGGTEAWLARMRASLETAGCEVDYEATFTPNEIFVFTPTGDLRQLKVGATALDFAFDIHSNLGCRCTGAIRNGKHVSIRETLQTGDVVDVLTAKNQVPTLDWLEYVTTAKAKNKIRQKLREDEAKVAAIGREALERKLKNWKLGTSTDAATLLLVKRFKMKTATELFVKLALEELDFALVHDVLQRHAAGELQAVEKESAAKRQAQKSPDKATSSSDYVVVDEQLSSVEYKLGKCCNPIYGDDIFGFVTVGSGITIHRTSCPNAERLFDLYAYRVIPAKWRQQADSGSFQAVIKISAGNEVGIQQKLSDVVDSCAPGAIRSLQLTLNRGMLEGQMRVFVKNVKQLDFLLYHLRNTKGLHKAVRVGC
ncbi:MAG: RelA/SpoT family protein [Prevotellaceae bacterium]|jgi:GTP pyrophosphokinase|nr:RelA/SpoT family protein [Prevotellaceae bacterium]